MTTNARSTPANAADLPATYEELAATFGIPRPIHDAVADDNATEIIDMLAGRELNADQSDYLDAWSTFMEIYENESEPAGVTGIELLKMVMDSTGTRAADLSRLLGVDPSLMSRILKGERSLTITQIKVLATHFALNPAALMG